MRQRAPKLRDEVGVPGNGIAMLPESRVLVRAHFDPWLCENFSHDENTEQTSRSFRRDPR